MSLNKFMKKYGGSAKLPAKDKAKGESVGASTTADGVAKGESGKEMEPDQDDKKVVKKRPYC